MATNDVTITSGLIPGVGAPAAIPVQGTRAQDVDPFAAKAGPDISYRSTEVYAVFRQDPQTRQMQVAIFDGDGRLLRMIPPASVAQMVATMSAYRFRR